MSRGLRSCAIVALLLAVGANAAGRSLQQTAGAAYQANANIFPYYDKCERRYEYNAFTLDTNPETKPVAGGTEVCYTINMNTGCIKLRDDNKPNICCGEWEVKGKTYYPEIYKMELEVKSNCRNSIHYGADDIVGPKIYYKDGTSKQVLMDWNIAKSPDGKTHHKARFTHLDLSTRPADNYKSQESRLCFVIRDSWTPDQTCTSLDTICEVNPANPVPCKQFVTLIEEENQPRPVGVSASGHVCCPVPTEPTCGTVLAPKGGKCSNIANVFETISDLSKKFIGEPTNENILEQCCFYDCDTADRLAPGYDCPAGYENKPGRTTYAPWNSIAEFQRSCCVPKTCRNYYPSGCPINNGLFDSPAFTRGDAVPSNYNTQQIEDFCCDFDCTSADRIYDCDPGYTFKSGPLSALSRTAFQSQCCYNDCSTARPVFDCAPGSDEKFPYPTTPLNPMTEAVYQSQCCVFDCNTADRIYDCAGGKIRNGNIVLTQLSNTAFQSQCCRDPDVTCAELFRNGCTAFDSKLEDNKPWTAVFPKDTPLSVAAEICCKPKTCPDYGSEAQICGTDFKWKTGYDAHVPTRTDSATLKAECCDPKPCTELGLTCSTGTYMKDNANTIFPTRATFQTQCCKADCNSVETARLTGFTCDPRMWNNDNNFELIQPLNVTDYQSKCCSTKVCKDEITAAVCAANGFIQDPAAVDTPIYKDQLFNDKLDQCCNPLLPQKYPFPYCRCEGSYNASLVGGDYTLGSGDRYKSDSGSFIRNAATNLPFRLDPETMDVSDQTTYTEYCFDLLYTGATPVTSAKPTLLEWCSAQTTLYRIEFLSSRDCSKDKYTAVFKTEWEGQPVELPLGVEDQWENQDTQVLRFNNVQHPVTGNYFIGSFQNPAVEDRKAVFPAVFDFTPKDSGYVKAAAKAVKISDYLDKGLGMTIGSGEGMQALVDRLPEGGTVGKMCIRLKKSNNAACSNLKAFCGGYFADRWEENAPGNPEKVRCEWALMEGRNQKCCPVQTEMVVA